MSNMLNLFGAFFALSGVYFFFTSTTVVYFVVGVIGGIILMLFVFLFFANELHDSTEKAKHFDSFSLALKCQCSSTEEKRNEISRAIVKSQLLDTIVTAGSFSDWTDLDKFVKHVMKKISPDIHPSEMNEEHVEKMFSLSYPKTFPLD